MEIRVLRYFLAVAREESVTKAAQALHITQPTLSRQLAQLEEEMGVKLLERGARKVALTGEGMLLRRRAEEIVELAEKAARELTTQEAELTGNVAIGCGELESSQLLAHLIAGFQKEHPAVHFELYSGNSDNIKERLENGLLDIGLLLEPMELSKYRFLRTGVKEEWGIFVPADSPLARKETVRPKDLANSPLIMGQREAVQGELRHWLGSYGDKIKPAASGNLHYNLSLLAKEGVGVYIGIKLNCSYPGLAFVPLSPKLEFRTVLVWKQSQALSPAVSAFIRYLENRLKTAEEDKEAGEAE